MTDCTSEDVGEEQMCLKRLVCLLTVGVMAFSLGCRAPQSPGTTTHGPRFGAGGPSSASDVDVAAYISPEAVPVPDGSAGGARGESELPLLDDGRWHFMVTPFMWASSIDGTVGKGALQGPVEEEFSDIVDDIDGSAQLHLAATNGDWAILSELAYYDMSVSDAGPLGFVSLDYDESKLDFELAVARRVLDGYLWNGEARPGRAGRGQVGVLGGARYTNLRQDFKFTGPLGGVTKLDEDESWIDPIIGARGSLGLSDSVELEARGDVGGFGVGSDLTWTAQGGLAWHVARRAALRAGYRHRSIDYSSGGFVYDVDVFGPFLSFTWTF